MSDAEVLGRDGPPAAALAAPHADPRQVSPWWLLLRLAYPAIGLALLFTVWWIGARLIALDPHMQAFTSFAPEATLPAFWDLLTSNELIEAAIPSLKRIGLGHITRAPSRLADFDQPKDGGRPASPGTRQ